MDLLSSNHPFLWQRLGGWSKRERDLKSGNYSGLPSTSSGLGLSIFIYKMRDLQQAGPSSKYYSANISPFTFLSPLYYETHRLLCWLSGKRIQDFGKVMYILLYLKWITNKNLLYSTWNSAQWYMPAWMEVGFEGEWIHINV